MAYLGDPRQDYLHTTGGLWGPWGYQPVEPQQPYQWPTRNSTDRCPMCGQCANCGGGCGCHTYGHCPPGYFPVPPVVM